MTGGGDRAARGVCVSVHVALLHISGFELEQNEQSNNEQLALGTGVTEEQATHDVKLAEHERQDEQVYADESSKCKRRNRYEIKIILQRCLMQQY